MKWNKETGTLAMTARDLRLMVQCRMPFPEVSRAAAVNRCIPPLWTVLSFMMLYLHPSVPAQWVWKWYRELQRIAENRDLYYRDYKIKKRSGGLRAICMPKEPLAQLQQFILETILREIPVDAHAFAYRPGVGIRDCAVPHLWQNVLIHADIKDFFHSVREDMVFKALLRETGYSNSLVRFLSRVCCYRDYLPQGACTSPALSNIVFKPCDEALAAMARRLGLEYTRYSDDLYFSGGRGVDAEAAVKELRQILADHGFCLNTGKTKVSGRQQRQCVVGVVVNRKLQVTRQYRRDLLQELYYVEKFGADAEGAKQLGDYRRYLQILQGKVAHVLHIDPNNEKFRRAQCMLKMLLRQLPPEKRYLYIYC